MSRALSSAIARRTSSTSSSYQSPSSGGSSFSSPSISSKSRFLAPNQSGPPMSPPPSLSSPGSQLGRNFLPQSNDEMHLPHGVDKKGLVPVNKLSISDAIALITIRLGRLETFMHQQEAKDAGIIGTSSSAIGGDQSKEGNTSEDQMVMMSSLLNRMELMEKQISTLLSSSSLLLNGQESITVPSVDVEDFKNELSQVKLQVEEVTTKVTETTNNVMKLQTIVLEKLLTS